MHIAAMPKKLLMLNWRCPWNPRAGGAEFLTRRILEGLVAAHGWTAEWHAARFPSSAAQEYVAGVRYVRAGSELTVRWHAFRRYRSDRSVDIVVDQTNTIPFFTPLYARVPIVLLIYQLAREVWWYETPFPVAALGYVIEPLMLRPYRNARAITISESSKQSLRDIGLRGPISILPIAVDEPGDSIEPAHKSLADLLVLGRVTPSKRIEHALEAAAVMRARGWSGSLRIAGGGRPSYVGRLKWRAFALGLNDVQFCGRVDRSERTELLRNARLLWMTSAREGWGLVIPEAGRHWTPAVVYDVAGLRDAVVNDRTGLVVAANATALADASLDLLRDPARAQRYARAAYEYSNTLTWEKTIAAFDDALSAALAPPSGPSSG